VRLVPPGDGASFGKALTEVLQDDAHARALGAAARRTVERDLSWEGYVERLSALLHAAAGSARRDRGNQGD
jgi:glycosyltransferase involved in cell wall biosynthesis